MSNLSKEFELLEYKREAMQKECNANNIKPISFDIYKKTTMERMELANAKSSHKMALKMHYGKSYSKKIFNIH